ncbi:MAG TPA: outer membrane beta-barrel protein [Phnomibacter sp.]|nr:outer membrane beta-barrel protein [Phnomibacter sp.]
MCTAQVVKTLYREERENDPFYFGLSLGYASAYLHPSKHPYFLENDSILLADPGKSPGYSLRLIATARLSKRFEIRANPGLILGLERSFTYKLGSRQLYEDEVVVQKIQSNIATFPFHVKLNSDRIQNFKVYMLAGIKYDIDLASNAKATHAEDMVKLKGNDFGAEFGIGFNFFLPFVTVSPELKFSNGFSNVHSRDANLKYSAVFDQLKSRMVFFTIHLEQ